MFTGIIQHVGEVTDVRAAGSGRRLTIDLGPPVEGLAVGGSVAVNGACLTACAVQGPLGSFDVIAETLSRTTLGRLSRGERVNLERALRVSDHLDGHIVQGHVDGMASVRELRKTGQWLVEFEAEPELTSYMVPKGSVAIDGVSLTLVDAADGRFSVALIPTTLKDTTLSRLAVGSVVNVEADILGKYVRRLLPSLDGGGLTMDKLRQAGFA